MIYQVSDFWWKSITGPHAFVKKVVDTLYDHKFPLLSLPRDLPWRHSMRNAVLDSIREIFQNDEPYIEIIDISDEYTGDSIGEFLLSRFGMHGVATGYRPQSGKSIQQYIIDNKVLSKKILWIKGIPPELMNLLIKFCQGCTSASSESGLFIIESCLSKPPAAGEKFAIIDFERFVSHYDLQLFNSFLLSSQDCSLSKPWQKYIAVAAAHLCEFDAELSEKLMLHEAWNETDPCDILRQLANDFAFAQRGTGHDSNHVFSYLHKNIEELSKRLWAAQVQILFPLIEIQRLRIINILEIQLAEILKNNNIDQFKQKVETPQELELGTLVYLLAQKTMDGKRILYVPDESLRSKIYLLRDCRNQLAHLHQCCLPVQVDRLFALDEC